MASSGLVKASHILIKHEGSPRKASWKDPTAAASPPPPETLPSRRARPSTVISLLKSRDSKMWQPSAVILAKNMIPFMKKKIPQAGGRVSRSVCIKIILPVTLVVARSRSHLKVPHLL